MRNFLLLSLCSFSLSFAQVQNVTFTIEPAAFNENEEITITVSNVDPTLWNNEEPDNIYLWAWYFDNNGDFGANSPTNGEWTNSDETQKLINNGDGTYSYTLTPTSFYGTTGISRLGMLVKAKNGDGDRKSQDFLVDVGRFQTNLTSPTRSPLVIASGETFTISATASLDSDFVLKGNGVQINMSGSATTNYTFDYAVTEDTAFELEVSNDGETIKLTFDVTIIPMVTEEALPAGLLDGLNPSTLSEDTATFVLYAPGKEFIYLIGDFNNWEKNSAYLMKKDPITNRFWLEVSGFTPRFNHLYQYTVDGALNVADPYSTLILDEFNDPFINSTTYPDLPAYPEGKTNGAVTVMRLGDNPYNWQVTDFTAPDREDLVVYELLIRDFDELHSFDAVQNRLDYLETLGVNAIEFMPLNEFDGNESWGYNPSFHMALDKYYGTKDAFKALVDECHKRGIAVFVDVVYNHASGQHPYYRMWNTSNGGFDGQASAENPFFNPTATHSYSVFNDFDHSSTATRAYVERTVKYWITEYNLDGFRWDLTKGFTQNCTGATQETCTNDYNEDRVEVLKLYADYQWETDDDFYVIFEHLGIGGSALEETAWVEYRLDEGKGIMFWNKLTPPYNEATMGYHEDGKSNFSAISYKIKGWTTPANVSYMESHDEERLMFKNLEFGNQDGSYSVRNLPTALSRIKTAGAFFFTVPGPKMIWQFGELGYEVSIDFNGRTGNKPIRWEYFEDPNRKAIYDTWANLIKLKLKEPIFQTEDFELNLGSESGLKKIHLTLESAADDEIKYVTIIGNFGVLPQNINPAFQETGVWYEFLNTNRKRIVANANEAIRLLPGEFRIYGNNPSALFPNDNPPDQDNDGVLDVNDLCPDTPFGTTVGVDGCEAFTLPGNNFTVKSSSETCRNSNNGSIEITAQQNFNYTATLNGASTNQVKDFTEIVSFTDLQAGDYAVCITVEGENDYEICFDLSIDEPENLAVFSRINKEAKQISLSLSGSDLYYIALNNKVFETRQNEITIDLALPVNRLKVSTAKDCQGTYEKVIRLTDQIIVYPNPSNNGTVTIETNLVEDQPLFIKILNLAGQEVMRLSHTSKNGRILFNSDKLSTGIYFIQIESQNTYSNFKFVKQ
ncbi:alpha-amylase family glycosyl hydrolase [Ascidiimonas sp. W6]|uniref:alpha-amylase family glycosyl hydrolase n=1 Tax=Ascidiimonas meishanensis TaxID=3128903 RepID=UPI0030ED5B4D